MKLATVTSLIFASIVSAVAIPVITITLPTDAEDTHPISYPETAESIAGRTQITNAQLLQKGQPLAKPVKLYDANRKFLFSRYYGYVAHVSGLAKRLNNAPPQASSVPAAGTTSGTYLLIGCATSLEVGQSFGDYTVSGSLQQQANACATRSRADGPSPGDTSGLETFALVPASASNCYTQLTGYTAEACTANNAGIYRRVA